MPSRLAKSQFDLASLRRKLNILAVFALILGYYTLVFSISSRLFLFSLSVNLTPPSTGMELFLAGIAAILAVRLFVHLVLAVYYLVTAQRDQQERIMDGVELDAFQNEAIYRLIDEVARRVGSPIPERVWISPLPECFTLEIRHFGLRTRRRQLLAIGYPQLLVLSLAEVRVIVAHELAHLENDTRMVVLVYRFLDWLRKDSSVWWRFVDPASWFMRAFSSIFCVFAIPLLRSQEYEADRVSAILCGSVTARKTLLKNWIIDHQFETALRLSEEAGDAADVYRRFQDNWRELSDDGFKYLIDRLEEEEDTSFWDSHPTMTQRMSRIAAEEAIGIHPASDRERAYGLISDLPHLEEGLLRCLSEDSKPSPNAKSLPLNGDKEPQVHQPKSTTNNARKCSK